MQQLGAAGVQTTINYPIPLHLQPAYSDLGYKIGDFPHAEKLAAEQISLPVYAELTRPEIEQVCAVMTKRQVAMDRNS
jgi:dTDP-4-amino-4,6-dideoxygalactose transaminase